MIDIYGIPNCGSVKRPCSGRENGVDFVFHNFKTEAPSVELIDKWMDEIGAARLLNRLESDVEISRPVCADGCG